MVGTVNKVILIGNVGRDPDIRYTPDGKKIANFSVATSENWKDKTTGDRKEKTEWHKVVVFVPQLVDIIEKFLKKGNKVYLEGSLQTRRWMDQSNTEKYVTEVLLQSYNSVLMLLDSRGKEQIDGVSNEYDKISDSKHDLTERFTTTKRGSSESVFDDVELEELGEDDVPF